MFLSNTLIRAVVQWFPYDARTVPRDEVFAAFRRISTVTEAGLVAACLLFGGVVLWLAAANHRRIDHSRGAIAWQAAIILAVITLAMAFPALVQLTFRPRA